MINPHWHLRGDPNHQNMFRIYTHCLTQGSDEKRPCVDSTMYFSTFATSTGKKLSLTKSFGMVRVDKGKA